MNLLRSLGFNTPLLAAMRPSKHCQSGTPEAIARPAEQIAKLRIEGQCLFRLDSGNDAGDNFNRFGEKYFIIKRNPRNESPE